MIAEALHRAQGIVRRVEKFAREIVVPYESYPRIGSHGPNDKLTQELKDRAHQYGVKDDDPHSAIDCRIH